MSKITVQFKTVQASAIKVLVEALKEIIHDVNLIINSDKIRIMDMDGHKVALVYLELDALSFEHYECKTNQNLGINMSNLYKLLKNITNTDSITFTLYTNNPNELAIKVENADKRTIVESKLKLLDINAGSFKIPNITFSSVITMPSGDFQKYCRDLLHISQTIQIKSINDTLEFLAEGDFASQKIVIGETQNGLVFSKKEDEEVSGIFSLKYLNLFTKSTNLCNTVELYLKKDYPFILVYHVANLGTLKYGLAPKTDC